MFLLGISVTILNHNENTSESLSKIWDMNGSKVTGSTIKVFKQVYEALDIYFTSWNTIISYLLFRYEMYE